MLFRSYLIRQADGASPRVIAALNYTVLREPGHKPQWVMSNMAVHPDMRRQGLASALVSLVLRDHPEAKRDTSLTPDGAAFWAGFSMPNDTCSSGPAPRHNRKPSHR